MSRADRAEAYRAKCKAAEEGRRERAGLKPWSPPTKGRKRRAARPHLERDSGPPDPLDEGDNIGESPDY